MQYYLGIDIGASSGRHMLGWKEQGEWNLEEVYRFDNHIIQRNGRDCWDLEYLFHEILEGIKVCVKQGKTPSSVSIDTWGCDYVLLDETGTLCGDCICYRDEQFQAVLEDVFAILGKEELYERTGIQFQPFNTLIQLVERKQHQPELFKQAKHFLMVPDYFLYLLSGVMINEYTNASTTQMVNVHAQQWDEELIRRFNLPMELFQPLTSVGTCIGRLRPEYQEELGCNMKLIACASHDTACAFAAAQGKDQLILSSGTWSLLGVIQPQPNTSKEACLHNFTNEGAHNKEYRFLKNIMGLWMIQCVRHELNDAYSFAQLVEEAKKCTAQISIIDVNDPCFLMPDHMMKTIQNYCIKRNLFVPQTPGEFAKCIYHSLAHSYQEVCLEIEALCGRQFEEIHIVGGGNKNELLNTLVAQYTGKKIIIGPSEATALGNLMMQEGGSSC